MVRVTGMCIYEGNKTVLTNAMLLWPILSTEPHILLSHSS